MEMSRSAVKHRVCWQCGQKLWSSLGYMGELAAGANRCRVYWCPLGHEGWLLDEVSDVWQPLRLGDLADWRAAYPAGSLFLTADRKGYSLRTGQHQVWLFAGPDDQVYSTAREPPH